MKCSETDNNVETLIVNKIGDGEAVFFLAHEAMSPTVSVTCRLYYQAEFALRPQLAFVFVWKPCYASMILQCG